NQISLSLFSPANTLAALLALNFPEAGQREVQVLMYAALVLLAVTLVVNLAGEALMTFSSASRQRRATRGTKRAWPWPRGPGWRTRGSSAGSSSPARSRAWS